MRKLFKTVKVIGPAPNQKDFFLDYYILEKEVQLEGICVSRFGMEICKRAQRDDGAPYIEYRKVFDVFHTESEAITILEMMSRNTVTPISMKEVLEDLLGIQEFIEEELYIEAV